MASLSKFATDKPGMAVSVLADFFPKVRMSNPGSDFAFEIESIQDTMVSAVRYHLRSPGSESAADTSGSLTLGRLTQGNLRLTAGKDSIDTSRPWIFPNREVVGQWDEVSVDALSLSVPETLRFARGVVGDDRFKLEFRGTSPVDDQRAQQWDALVAYTVTALEHDGPVMNSDIVRVNAFTHLIAALLATFPNNAMDSESGRPLPGRFPGSVRRAIEFMEANASSPITIVEIAESAHLSVRGLQYAFRNALDTTPLEYLRRVRLARAHADLVAGDPTRGDTVRDIAHAWGFVHLGRFAEQYRTAYGVTPRHTLDS